VNIKSQQKNKNKKMNTEQVKAAFEAFDLNKDGKISMEGMW